MYSGRAYSLAVILPSPSSVLELAMWTEIEAALIGWGGASKVGRGAGDCPAVELEHLLKLIDD
jgi:hypothetical protein